MTNVYEQVNTKWPKEVPPLTRGEATKAAHRLVKRFRGPLRAREVRRCWVTARPGLTNKGWWRLVHDISHMTFERLHPQTRPHSGFHAHLEREMVEYVIARGWLDGTLKPKVRGKLTPEQRREGKLIRARSMVTKWERRSKLSTTKLKVWRRRVATLERTSLKGAAA